MSAIPLGLAAPPFTPLTPFIQSRFTQGRPQGYRPCTNVLKILAPL